MRKLASIQTVNAAEPIPDADAIEKIRVLGWWVVVKKGEFKPGDKVVYCEIDALLPETAAFEFLRPNCYKPAQTDSTGAVIMPAGFRIKTIKLRGQVSQGICFPLSVLPAGTATEEDTDVTDALGVRKWEPPQTVGMGGRVKGSFPGFLPKTDETRVQVLEKVIERHRGLTFFVTEKLDGTSFTAFARAGEFGVCSRNMLLDTTDRIVGGSSSNVFAVRGTELVTPAVTRNGIAGVMRRVVLETAPRVGLVAREADLTLSDLNEADELFMTNALIGIWPVARLDERAFARGPATVRLMQHLGYGVDA